MSAKKATAKKNKGGPAARGRRNSVKVIRAWGDGEPAPAGENGNGTRASAVVRKRNPAKLPEESKEVQKANELMLRAWERIYAKRDKFGKLA